MVEPEAADLAGAVLDRDYQIFIAFELRDKVNRGVFPPIDLALRERLHAFRKQQADKVLAMTLPAV